MATGVHRRNDARPLASRRAWRRQGAGIFEKFGALALLGPQAILGGWLLIVPDHVAFTASQLAVLAHVALAAAGIPIAVVWSVRHIRRSGRRARRTALARAIRWALVGTVALAFASGIPTIWSSQGMPMAQGHAVLGAAVALVLVVHLLVEQRRLLGVAVTGAVGLVVTLLVVARIAFPGNASPASPPFAYALRSVSLYDRAAWCGSCHQQNFSEWSRSTHGHAMDLPAFREDLAHRPVSQAVDLLAVGKGAAADPGSPVLQQLPPIPDQCPMCHAPATYFGDDALPPLEANGPTSEGVTCSFCHTLRGINAHPEADQKARAFIAKLQRGEARLEDTLTPDMFRLVPLYVSAPETVRRYLGQSAVNPVARVIGDYLIRWRPAVHRSDYHSPFLNTSQVCEGCHGVAFDAPETPHKTYPDWAASPYNTKDASVRVECQDCHMVRELTGRPVREPDRLVPWGPVRAQRRSHLFLGGNARANTLFQDADAAARQRELARRALRMTVDSATVDNGRVRARITLTNERIAHAFPAMETVQRFAFVRVAAFDSNGRLIVESPKPSPELTDDSGSPVLFRSVDPRTLRIHRDTTVPARESRSYEAFVDLPAGAPPVARVEARLGHNFDPEPFLVSAVSLDGVPAPQ